MKDGKVILDTDRFKLTIDRLTHELHEVYGDFTDVCIIGIQERGALLADRLVEKISEFKGVSSLVYGKLDITFYRDDFRRREIPIKASKTEIDFIVEGKRVLLIDDVLYTGRTIQAALSAIQDFGRPSKIELLALIDRRFNRHLPIMADYVGHTVDSINDAYVKVDWKHIDGKDGVKLLSRKHKNDG